MGLVEVVDPATGFGVAPGELGSVTITPYFPYRECMPLLRYDTRDMVRRLTDNELTCELAGMPATSAIAGKAGHLSQRRQTGTAGDMTGVPHGPGPATIRAVPVRARAELRELTFTSLESS
jgi:hypothetical protein